MNLFLEHFLSVRIWVMLLLCKVETVVDKLPGDIIVGPLGDKHSVRTREQLPAGSFLLNVWHNANYLLFLRPPKLFIFIM